ncbi:lactonase family protein [Micromonosporaceae bacterium Da 78-11]
MKTIVIAGAVLASTFAVAGPAAASGVQPGFFVQTNAADGNRVVAYDSALKPAGSYSTGGNGGSLTGAVVDRLASQGSLTLDRAHGLLYAVNAGSDTVTVFGVRGTRLTKLQVIGSGGAFPVSIAVHGDLVYVLNARDGGSVQGFQRLGSRLVRVPFWNRRLGLDPAAAPEFTHTPGQVTFSPDGSQLLVTTKANTNAIDVYAVDRVGGLSKSPVVNVEDGAVPFAAAFDRRGNLAVAEAGPNAVATFDLHRDGRITRLDTAATGQAATCWIVYANGVFYASNAGSGTVSAYRAGTDGGLTALGTTSTHAGTVDAAVSADGRHLYVQTGAEGTVDAFRINAGGSLTATGSVTVAGTVGGEGIAAG